MRPLTHTIKAFLRELGRALLPRPETEGFGGLASRDGAAAAPPWSGSDVALVLATGAALTVAMFALSLAITWVLAARARPDPKAVFFAMFDDRIRGGFPAQTAESMTTMLTGVNTVLRANPETPCVLLLVSAPGAEATALRMAQALARAVQTVLRGWPGMPSSPEELEVMGDTFPSSDDYWRLYEALSRRLEDQRVAVVRDLQAIHPRAAAAIAHLCDDTFPPFPQSVLMLLLSPGEFFPDEVGVGVPRGPAETVVLAEECLLACWQARGPPPSSGAPPPAWASRDVLPTVLGRLTGRAVLVRPEPLDLPAEPARPGHVPVKEGALARTAIRAR